MVTIAAARRAVEDLIDTRLSLRRLASGFRFTEGPIWDQRREVLLFSDIQADSRWQWTADDGATLVAHPNYIGNGMVLDRDGELLICEHVTSSVVRVRADGARELVAWHYRGTYLNSPNDVVTRSDGTVYFTDPDYGRWDHPVGVSRPLALGFAGLYRVPPGGEVELAASAALFDQPNGLCFSPDETSLYVDDRDGLRAFTVRPNGELAAMRSMLSGLRTGPRGLGGPDGMKCDADGNVWCTGPGGVWILTPEGELLGVLETPEIVANLTWGGPDLRTLFLCTSTTIHAVRTRVPAAPLPYHRVTHGVSN